MNPNSLAIIILCSHLCTGEEHKPFEPAEWTKFADVLMDENIQPSEVLSFNNIDIQKKLQFNQDEAERIVKLISRSASITFEIEKYASMGIKIMTRADDFYPKSLKRKLGKLCPPLFFYVGNTSLTENKCIGFVGSRSIEKEDEDFTKRLVDKISLHEMTIVSGGAKGIDIVAQTAAFANGISCIEYTSDSLIKKIKTKRNVEAINKDKLLILSAAKPDAGFSVGIAMMRNKYIYSQSEGTVVVKSDYKKGGTWSGAIENIKHKRSETYCWDNPKYQGNVELIAKGAIPIDEQWNVKLMHERNVEMPLQLSLLDIVPME